MFIYDDNKRFTVKHVAEKGGIINLSYTQHYDTSIQHTVEQVSSVRWY